MTFDFRWDPVTSTPVSNAERPISPQPAEVQTGDQISLVAVPVISREAYQRLTLQMDVRLRLEAVDGRDGRDDSPRMAREDRDGKREPRSARLRREAPASLRGRAENPPEDRQITPLEATREIQRLTKLGLIKGALEIMEELDRQEELDPVHHLKCFLDHCRIESFTRDDCTKLNSLIAKTGIPWLVLVPKWININLDHDMPVEETFSAILQKLPRYDQKTKTANFFDFLSRRVDYWNNPPLPYGNRVQSLHLMAEMFFAALLLKGSEDLITKSYLFLRFYALKKTSLRHVGNIFQAAYNRVYQDDPQRARWLLSAIQEASIRGVLIVWPDENFTWHVRRMASPEAKLERMPGGVEYNRSLASFIDSL